MDAIERSARLRPAVRAAGRATRPVAGAIDTLDLVVAGFAIIGALLISFLR